jgi:hypothetical protein
MALMPTPTQVPSSRTAWLHSVSDGSVGGTGEQVDHPPEQDGVDELQAGDEEVGQRQRDGDLGVGPEQPDDATIDFEEAHGAEAWRKGRAGNFTRAYHFISKINGKIGA